MSQVEYKTPGWYEQGFLRAPEYSHGNEWALGPTITPRRLSDSVISKLGDLAEAHNRHMAAAAIIRREFHARLGCEDWITEKDNAEHGLRGQYDAVCDLPKLDLGKPDLGIDTETEFDEMRKAWR